MKTLQLWAVIPITKSAKWKVECFSEKETAKEVASALKYYLKIKSKVSLVQLSEATKKSGKCGVCGIPKEFLT
jgi:hypothetical protein